LLLLMPCAVDAVLKVDKTPATTTPMTEYFILRVM
jgi:hypothetical protein